MLLTSLVNRRLVRCASVVAVLSIAALAGKSAGASDNATTVTSVRFSPLSGPSGLAQEFRLRLYHLHTGESIDVAYRKGDTYLSSGVSMLNHFLRDHRTDDTADYDPREFDLLHSLLVKLGRPNAVIDIVCGYRTAWSNNYLRTRNEVTGVAEHSQHMLSKAIDIRIPGVSTLKLRNAALSLGMGGVGYYPTSQFVHVDVGPVREWQFGGRRLIASRSRGRGHGRHGRHRA